MDGVIAGEGDGPLSPTNVPLGAVIAATDPVALDLVALRLMGFDERNFPKICEPIRDDDLRITNVQDPQDVTVFEIDSRSHDVQRRRLEDIACGHVFAAHPGWTGHVERVAV